MCIRVVVVSVEVIEDLLRLERFKCAWLRNFGKIVMDVTSVRVCIFYVLMCKIKRLLFYAYFNNIR